MSNAKIQFTVRVEDIPNEVRQQLTRLVKHYDGTGFILKTILDLSTKDSPYPSAVKIEEVRKDIAFIDAVLKDCYTILVGYSNYQNSLLQYPNETVQEESQGNKNE